MQPKYCRAEVESRTQGSRPRPSTQKNFEAKDRTSRGQGQAPRIQTQVFSKKKVFKKLFQAISEKRGLKIFFSGEIGLQKIFFRRSPREENKKRSSQIFREVSGVFQQNFNGSKNSAVLEPRTGQFLRTWGFEAKAKDFKMCPRGQGRPRRLHYGAPFV